MGEQRISTPLGENEVKALRSGDRVFISGEIYTARDMAHKRLVEMLDSGQDIPLDLKGSIVYYVGPTPAPPGRVIGSAGPTTAGRMDPYTPRILAQGVRGLIGKGRRSPEVKEALVRYGAVYLAAMGGAGALLSRHITGARAVLFEDLGPEAVYLLQVKEFPVVVVNDIYGNDLYEDGVLQYRLDDRSNFLIF